MRISDWSSDVCSSDLRHNLAARPYAFVHLDDTLVQHLRQHDVPVEQPRARLVADPERVAEPLGDYQDGPLSLALQEGVGGDGGAHLDGVDTISGDRLVGLQAEQVADAPHGGGAEMHRFSGPHLLGDTRYVP